MTASSFVILALAVASVGHHPQNPLAALEWWSNESCAVTTR